MPKKKGKRNKRKRKNQNNDVGQAEKRKRVENTNENVSQTTPTPEKQTKTVWAPGMEMGDDEKLVCDFSAYTSYFKLNVEWPFLSFDYLRDSLGGYRQQYPHTFYCVGGTQAGEVNQNKITLMKITDLHQQPNEDDVAFDEEDVSVPDPLIESISWRHPGVCNRIRAMPQNRNVLATWSDLGRVYMWNCEEHNSALDSPLAQKPTENLKPTCTFKTKIEGFALDWHPRDRGLFLSGDCERNIHLWRPRESTWDIDETPFKSHNSSVEDIQWSTTESTVFASCGVDGTVRIWDIRQSQHKNVLCTNAHETDVNVISWNALTPNLLASGSDDCSFKIWDLRTWGSINPSPMAHFTWHRGPINSLQFHPFQASTLVVSGEDDQITFWDLSLEEDDDEIEYKGAELNNLHIPAQLLFIHQGQEEIKEVKFHPQIPSLCVSSSIDSMNLFQPQNIKEEVNLDDELLLSNDSGSAKPTAMETEDQDVEQSVEDVEMQP